MARKRSKIISSSSEHDEQYELNVEEESEEIPVQPYPNKSGSDSQSDKSSPVPVEKPIRVSSKKPDPKPNRKRASAKSPVESDKNVTEGKKARVSNGDENKSGSNRVWSEEDELVILQGMIDYRLANYKDPHSDYEAFFEFVKDWLHVNVSIRQLSDKMRKLRKKYLANAEKGDDFVFVKPNEKKLFELSKKIWGGGNGDKVKEGRKKTEIGKAAVNEKDDVVIEDGDKVKEGRKKTEIGKAVVNEKDDVVIEDEVENGVEDDEEENEGLDFKAMYPFLSEAWESDVSCSQSLKDISVGIMTSIAGEKIRGLEKDLKDVCVKELELYVKKLDLKTKVAKVVLDQMRSSDP